MTNFAMFLETESFPIHRSFDNIQPVIDKIKSLGYEVHEKGTYVGIWRNYASRGYREVQFAFNSNIVDAYYDCCFKFIQMKSVHETQTA
jgi:hypothetical protein